MAALMGDGALPAGAAFVADWHFDPGGLGHSLTDGGIVITDGATTLPRSGGDDHLGEAYLRSFAEQAGGVQLLYRLFLRADDRADCVVEILLFDGIFSRPGTLMRSPSRPASSAKFT